MAQATNPFVLIKRGNKAELKRFLKKESKDYVKSNTGDYGQTLLHVAAYEGQVEMAEVLIDKYKADVNAIDRNGWTPLHSAATSGSIEVCEMLLVKGAFARALTNEGASPLHYLVRCQPKDPVLSHKVFKLILDKGGNINQQNKFGETPLHQAAQRGRTQWALYLLNAFADVNVPNNFGETCLHFAIRGGHKDTVGVLLRFGANPMIKSSSGTCLELAKRFPDQSMTKMLESAMNKQPGMGSSGQLLNVEDGFTKKSPSAEFPSGTYEETISTIGLTSTNEVRVARSFTTSEMDQRTPPLLSFSGSSLRAPSTARASLESYGSNNTLLGCKMSISADRLPSVESLAILSDKKDDYPTVVQPEITAQKGWICKLCEAVHMDLPLSYHTRAPHPWDSLTDEERSSKTKLSTDLCTIDDRQFFIRGLLELPIKNEESGGRAGERQWFSWGVWISVSQENFEKILQDWCRNGREDVDPVPGELASNLGVYAFRTLGLKVKLKIRERGIRPAVYLDQSEHQLYYEQSMGIDNLRLAEFADKLLHPPST